jgi:hypothetical protein
MEQLMYGQKTLLQQFCESLAYASLASVFLIMLYALWFKFLPWLDTAGQQTIEIHLPATSLEHPADVKRREAKPHEA